jgi:hypothetical protein
MSGFNDFLAKNGGSGLEMDETLMLQYEDGEQRVWWASVYGSKPHRVPKWFFTTQNTYREFCGVIAGMMPKHRLREDFDDYVRRRMAVATVKEPLPGLEDGVVVGDTIFSAIREHYVRAKDYDDEECQKVDGPGSVMFIESRPEGGDVPEIFLRINNLMRAIVDLQMMGRLERKVNREEVCEWLVAHCRAPYPRTGTSPRRLRSTYPVPVSMYENWRYDDTKDEVDRLTKEFDRERGFGTREE